MRLSFTLRMKVKSFVTLNKHSALVGMSHAFMSPSKPAWVNYEPDKLIRVWHSSQEARRGTEMHELAARLIKLGVRLPDTTATINQYVNDAIGYRMTPEQVVAYSSNCFGTADAMGFRANFLRVHDLKTGVNEATMTQLKIYVALFCLEYGFKPNNIGIETRIYQNDAVVVQTPEADEIFHIMDKIVTFDKIISDLRAEVE